jgi:hypothetical protein
MKTNSKGYLPLITLRIVRFMPLFDGTVAPSPSSIYACESRSSGTGGNDETSEAQLYWFSVNATAMVDS